MKTILRSLAVILLAAASHGAIQQQVGVRLSTYGGQTSRFSGFIAVGSGGRMTRSEDGLTWSEPEVVGPSNTWRCIACGGGRILVAGENGLHISSGDGLTWTEPVKTTEVSGSWLSVAYGMGRFVLTGSYGKRVAVSVDGIVIDSLKMLSNTGFLYSAAYGNNGFVVAGSVVYASQDGNSWGSAITISGQSGEWYGLIADDYRYMVVGAGGKFSRSEDGSTWSVAETMKTLTATNTILMNAVTYGDGKFVAVGRSGRFATYEDKEWTATGCANRLDWSTTLNGCAYGRGRFVIVGDRGHITSSSDGKTWDLYQTVGDSTVVWYGVAYFAE